MSVAQVAKALTIEKYQLSVGDTGSSPVQIALLTARIRHLTEHLRTHRKDYHTAYGLKKMVSQRKKLMKYFKAHSLNDYQQLLKSLELRDIK